MYDGVLRLGNQILGPRTYFTALTAYVIALWFLRLWLFPAGSADDAEQLFFAQSFELGYKPGQPPLYTWLVWLSERVFGPSLGLVVAIKYALLWLVHLMAFLLTLQLTRSARWGVLAAVSLFGLYYLAWDSLLNYSQTVLVAVLAFAGVMATRAVTRSGTPTTGVLLGLVIGAGIMTKYNFALFGLALVGAALMDRRGRRALIGPTGVAALTAALAIGLPHLIWLATGGVSGSEMVKAVPSMTATSGDGFDLASFGASRALGLLDTLEAVVSILMPFGVIWLIFLPKSVGRIGAAAGEDVTGDLRLMARVFGLFVAQVLLLVAVAGMTEVRNHWFVVLAPVTAYAVLRAAAVYGDPGARRVSAYAVALMLLAVVSMTGVGVRAVLEKTDCERCPMIVPYDQVARALIDAGFEHGTVYVQDYPMQVGGNLRPYLPESRFESRRYEGYLPPPNRVAGSCAAVWLTDDPVSKPPRYFARRLAVGHGVEIADPDAAVRTVDVTISDELHQTYAMLLVLDPATQGTCR